MLLLGFALIVIYNLLIAASLSVVGKKKDKALGLLAMIVSLIGLVGFNAGFEKLYSKEDYELLIVTLSMSVIITTVFHDAIFSLLIGKRA